MSGEAGGELEISLHRVSGEEWDWWLRTLHILIGNGELASCSGAGYGKTSVWGSFAFYSVLQGCKKESESETETERDWFQPGRPLRNFPVILCLTCTMVGGNGNRENGAKSEFNGRTNVGLLENGLELGFFRLLLERYVVDVFRSAGHNQVFTSCLPADQGPETSHENSSYSHALVVSSQQERVFAN